jgi:SAM-dependent methyltransferase
MSQQGITNSLARESYAHQRARTGGIKSVLMRYFPRPLLRRVKYLSLMALDGVDLVLGRRRELVPPRSLNFTGDGDFERTGDEFLAYFIDLAGLQPSYRVLEIGSGVGRMARPLTKYLNLGSYDGLDIVPAGVRWCHRNISSRYPNFRFHVADIQNRQYNPKGHFCSQEYKFPFGDREYDFVFLTSVFTHMLKPDMTHYLREISRMLKPKGVCLITFFLLNAESLDLIKAGASSINFRFSLDGCLTDDERVPENAVAYDEQFVHSSLAEAGLAVVAVKYGAWCGRRNYLSYQDVVVAQSSIEG